MKISIIISTIQEGQTESNRSKVWEGELEILRDQEYLTMISVMAEGEMQPICQIPFALGIGHYVWIAPDNTENTEREEFPESRDF